MTDKDHITLRLAKLPINALMLLWDGRFKLNLSVEEAIKLRTRIREHLGIPDNHTNPFFVCNQCLRPATDCVCNSEVNSRVVDV